MRPMPKEMFVSNFQGCTKVVGASDARKMPYQLVEGLVLAAELHGIGLHGRWIGWSARQTFWEMLLWWLMEISIENPAHRNNINGLVSGGGALALKFGGGVRLVQRQIMKHIFSLKSSHTGYDS